MRADIEPSVWGPPAWRFLDLVVLGYPKVAMMDDQVKMAAFINSLGYVLPCSKCRGNYTRFSANHPPELYVAGQDDLARWLNALKGNVRRDVGR